MSAENEDVKNKQFEDETEKENVAEDVAQNVESGEAEASDGEAKAAQDEGRDKLEKDFAKLIDDYIRLYAEMDNMKKPAGDKHPQPVYNCLIKNYSAGEIAPIGQASAQVPQSTQTAGSIL